MLSLSRDQLAERAGVDPALIEKLIRIGALVDADRRGALGPGDLSRVRLLRAWEDAGLSAEGIVRLVEDGDLSIEWLSAPQGMRADLVFYPHPFPALWAASFFSWNFSRGLRVVVVLLPMTIPVDLRLRLDVP